MMNATHQISNRRIYPDESNIPNPNQSNNHFNNHCNGISNIKTTLLVPSEVTFHDCDLVPKRKRLTTISSETTEGDSHASTSTINTTTKKKIPDGGYGWVVVFASLMVSLIADGVSFSFGLIYTELLKSFNEGETKTAIVGSLFMSVPLLVGPIMSNLVDKYGCQRMTMIGGVLGCAGFVLSTLTDSIGVMFITFGFISGVGLGVIYVTAVVSIAFWFESKRTFATGIGASGTGMGTFLYAPFTNWLIEYYGWRGATLILGGTILNFCVFGALMVDPEWLIEENKLEKRSQSMLTFSNSSVMCLDEIKKLLEKGDVAKDEVLDTFTLLVTNFNTEANQQIDSDIVAPKKYQSELLLPTFINSPENEGIRSSSRRSLHPERIKSPSSTVQSEFLSPALVVKSSNDNDKQYAVEKKSSVIKPKSNCVIATLASVETLNSSEKESYVNNQFSMSSLDCDAYDEPNNNFESQGKNALKRSCDDEDDEEIQRKGGKHGSRFSLNEAIIAKFSSDQNYDKIDIYRKFRGNSLNLIFNMEAYEKSIGPPYDVEALKEISKQPLKQKHRKPHEHNENVGNLKKNSSLRYSNYLKNMRVHRNSIHFRGALLSTHRYRLKASSCPNIYRNSMTTIAKESEDVWYDDFLDIIKSIFDFSLFIQYKFGMMSLSTLFLFVWYIIPYFYITEFLKSDYSTDATAMLISVIGFFNTIGMIFLGWVGDQKWCDVTKVYALCLFFCGVSMFLIPLATKSYYMLVILCGIFGITFASSFSFTPIITSRLVDMDDFTLAYGLILLVQGVGSLLGPPLAGLIFNLTDRWDDSFYAGGFFIAISGFLAYAIGDLRQEQEFMYDNDEENNLTKQADTHAGKLIY